MCQRGCGQQRRRRPRRQPRNWKQRRQFTRGKGARIPCSCWAAGADDRWRDVGGHDRRASAPGGRPHERCPDPRHIRRGRTTFGRAADSLSARLDDIDYEARQQISSTPPAGRAAIISKAQAAAGAALAEFTADVARAEGQAEVAANPLVAGIIGRAPTSGIRLKHSITSTQEAAWREYGGGTHNGAAGDDGRERKCGIAYEPKLAQAERATSGNTTPEAGTGTSQ